MNSNMNNTFSSNNYSSTPIVEKVQLNPIIVEKPTAIHEEIRQELVEEIQPVIEVEKYQTEIHQVTQPLFDKEIRPVNYEQRTLNTQYLPEVSIQGQGNALPYEQNTVNYMDSTSVTVEKPPMFVEVERNQIIEEIQPVIYKETIVPTLIQETKPVYQKIVEGPTYTQETMPGRNISGFNNQNYQQQQFQQQPVQQQPVLVEQIATGFIEEPVLIETPTRIIPAILEEPVIIEKVVPLNPPVQKKSKFHFPKFGKKNPKTIETNTTTVTTTDRPALAVTNELLYADGVSGANTILDGADPFNRDYLLADNPITHNEFASQPQQHHLPLKTAGPYLTSEPSLGGSHSRLVTPLGNGGDHYIDETSARKNSKKNANIDYNTSQQPANRI